MRISLLRFFKTFPEPKVALGKDPLYFTIPEFCRISKNVDLESYELSCCLILLSVLFIIIEFHAALLFHPSFDFFKTSMALLCALWRDGKFRRTFYGK